MNVILLFGKLNRERMGQVLMISFLERIDAGIESIVLHVSIDPITEERNVCVDCGDSVATTDSC